MEAALITGASGGIGLELAKIHAAKGGNLVLVARSEGKLLSLKQQLEKEFGVQAMVIAEDLSDPLSAQRIFERTQGENVEVGTLINNAGFGGHGLFHQRDLEAEQSMMQVNMVSLTNLTHLYLKGMAARNSGHILNVSSTASFIPGPLQAVYYASKAYVTSFSQALAEELNGTGVTVTALCPGAVATGFVAAGDLQGVDIWKNARSAESVARCGYQAMERGDLVAFNETRLKLFLNWIMPLLPRKMLLKFSRQTMEKS
ncbi:SDR family NAD(P)-dependent oxidoreductase [Microbulbifer sp. JMSA008]|uniref:SDR family NAD(P)-dependent oxidoreductase n=1 Tax=Microbulbifer sp. JMSA008 TaxID=3243373 RepID=UPI00403A5BE8